MGRDGLRGARRSEARGVGRDQEGGDALGARAAGAGEDDVEVGDAAVGDPGLVAVEDVAVAVAGGGEVHGGHVGARRGLGQREGGDGSARRGLGQQAAPSARRCRRARRRRSPGPAWRRRSRRGRRAGQVSRTRQRQRTSSSPPGGGVAAAAQPAVLAERGDERAAGGVGVGVVDGAEARRPRRRASSASARWRSSKKGQARKLLSGASIISCPRRPASPWRRRPGRRGAKSAVCMQIAWAWASASIAWSRPMDHSWFSRVLVIMWAKVGPSAMRRASASGLVLQRSARDQAVEEAPGERPPRRSSRGR